MAKSAALPVAREDIARCAWKLVETFSVQIPQDGRFDRFWRLAPRLEAFCETAGNPLEQQLAEDMRGALEYFLRDRAMVSGHIDADAVTMLLGDGWRKKRKGRAP